MAVDIGLEEAAREAIPIDFVDAGDWESDAAGLSERTRAFARACGFEAKPGQSLLEPGEDGALERVLFGVEARGARRRDPFLPGKLATLLPPGLYRFDRAPPDPAAAALAFLLSRYRFSRYLAPMTERARLCAPEGVVYSADDPRLAIHSAAVVSVRRGGGRASSSALVYPVIASAAWFQNTTLPSLPKSSMPSGSVSSAASSTSMRSVIVWLPSQIPQHSRGEFLSSSIGMKCRNFIAQSRDKEIPM